MLMCDLAKYIISIDENGTGWVSINNTIQSIQQLTVKYQAYKYTLGNYAVQKDKH